MRAIFIDSIHRTVTEIELSKNIVSGLELLLRTKIVALGNYVDENHMMYVDGGLVAAERLSFIFTHLKFPFPISGNGIILGITKTKGDKDCELDLNWVKNKVRFLTFEERMELILENK